MSMPPMGVGMGVAPNPIMGVAPYAGAAAGVAPRPDAAGVSSHLDLPFFGVGVAPMAGVSPGAYPGVASA